MNLKDLQTYGQSIWLDSIRRDLLTGGQLARLVKEDGVRGVTTNPAIFEKAIAGSNLYDASLERHVRTKDAPASFLYEQLAIEDIQQAADVLRVVYDATDKRAGYISMEVSPRFAHDTAGTLDEARRLWREVNRENLMIKVPATPEGIPAIAELTSEGINVNITLLFSREGCRKVFEAYMSGLEAILRRGGQIRHMASVASMFVSRIDAMVDPQLEARAAATSDGLRSPIRDLIGKVAIANAKLAYQDWKTTCQGERWQALAKQGGREQRLLWASTGTKDPHFRDLLYVECLIGPQTVDTIPPPTLDALRDHGIAENRLEQGIDDAKEVMATLAREGISLDAITRQLLDDGVKSFASAFDELLASIEAKRQGVLERLKKAQPAATA
jgi:transaldolase/glucose-6-phosphate isomerase